MIVDLQSITDYTSHANLKQPDTRIYSFPVLYPVLQEIYLVEEYGIFESSLSLFFKKGPFMTGGRIKQDKKEKRKNQSSFSGGITYKLKCFLLTSITLFSFHFGTVNTSDTILVPGLSSRSNFGLNARNASGNR